MNNQKNSAVVGCLHAAPVARSRFSISERATNNSGIKPVSGAAAELRYAPTTRENGHTARRYPNSVSRPLPLPQTQAGGTPLKTVGLEIVDGLCTVAGFLTLCVLGVFILALG